MLPATTPPRNAPGERSSVLPAAGFRSARGAVCVGGPRCDEQIQAAVNAARDGDTSRIAPGTYAGGVIVDRSVDLVGAGATATVISGGGHVITIGSASSTPTVTISGVTI